MKIVCSLRGLVEAKFPKQGILDIAEAGFENVSLDHGPDLLTEVVEQCRARNLNILMARWDFAERPERVSEEYVRLCGEAGCRYLVVPPLRGEEWAENRAYYLHLADVMKGNEVTILLENQCRDFNGHLVRGLCSDGREAAEWVDRLNAEAGGERFGFCMDVGNCNLCGQDMQAFVLALGSCLRAVVVRDCDGAEDSAQLPFTCVGKGCSKTDWLSLIRGLREIGFDGPMVMDFSDTVSAFSPLLRPQMMKLAKAIADYFQWQIGIENVLKQYPARVLFGAGNMCRNYMKCYGEKYPPLFTCSNSPGSWGKKFCGLEVRPPESLRELPEDCVVFICNTYYRDIEEQLREMGLPNPVSYFNDEYLPAFPVGRMEGR